MAADNRQPEIPRPVAAVIPIGRSPGARVLTVDKVRHDNPHWPVQSPVAAAAALLLHDECPWHCSTRIAALIVSAGDYQYFRDRGVIE